MGQSYISKSYLFKLSIPIFFSNIAIPLVGIVDTGLMGHLNSEIYLAAMSIGTSVITMVFWSFGFLRMGTVGLVSQAWGAKNYNDIALTICRNLIAALFISIVIILLKTPILFLIQNSFKTSFETQALIEEYVSIRLYSAPAELTIYILVGLYLGLQKTKISSFLISFFCFSNIILSTIFVLYLNLEIFGVALGTLISSYLTVGVFLVGSFFYFKKNFDIQISFKKIINRKKIFDLFKINFDIFIRTVLLTFSFLWITYLSSKLGENYLAVNAILLQFIMLASFILDSYAFSTEAIVGYTIGRKAKKNFLQVVSNSFHLSIFTGIIISLIYLVSSKFIISMLTDLDYLKYLSYEFIFWIIVIPPIASLCYQFDGIFIGASQTKEMRNSMIFSFLLFIISSNFLISKFGNHGLWMCLLFFMIMRSITLNYHFNKILKKF
jgi:MATE family multidrug resistance protein